MNKFIRYGAPILTGVYFGQLIYFGFDLTIIIKLILFMCVFGVMLFSIILTLFYLNESL